MEGRRDLCQRKWAKEKDRETGPFTLPLGLSEWEVGCDSEQDGLLDSFN